jgi:signal transduction histidine kinase
MKQETLERWRKKYRAHYRLHSHRRTEQGHARPRFMDSLPRRLAAMWVCQALVLALGVHFGWVWSLLAFALATAGGHFFVVWMLKPLDDLNDATQAFGRGELDHRIQPVRADELSRLGLRFNRMAEELQALLDGKRALLLSISHELRAPLSRARTHAELMEEGPSRESLLEELSQMREMTSALLESERLAAGRSALRPRRCDLARLAGGFTREGLRIDIEEELPQPKLDPLRMQLLMRNLINNALHHNEPGKGPVILRLAKEGQGIRLVVRDFGPGVPHSSLEHLGEPFYRPPNAGPRAPGGVGLGLTLCQLIAAAHGTRLELCNRDPGLEASILLG